MKSPKISTSKTIFYILLSFSVAFIFISGIVIYNVQSIRSSVEHKVLQVSELSRIQHEIDAVNYDQDINQIKLKFQQQTFESEIANSKVKSVIDVLNKTDSDLKNQMEQLEDEVALSIINLRKELGKDSTTLSNYWWISHVVILISCVISIISAVLGYKILQAKADISHLKSSQKEYFELTNDAIMSSNIDGDIVDVNQSALDLFGYESKEELENVGFHILYANSEDFFRVLKSIKNTGSFKGEIVNKKKNGERFVAYLSANAIKDEQGNLIGTMGISRDITQQSKMQQQLKESESNFRMITESLNDVFYLYNIVDQKYEYISPNCEEILGVKQSTILNNEPNKMTVYPEDLELVENAKDKVESGESYEIEYRLFIDNEIRWIKEKSVPIYDKKGNIIKNSGVCRDITIDKKAVEIIQEKNRLISNGIAYAKNIQNATIPSQSEMEKYFNEIFVFHRSKDTLSGDFFITSKIKTNDGVFMPVAVVADCTGHGIPGGILSLLCNALIKETFTNSKINSPSEALDYVRERVTSLLNENFEEKNHIYDGMDVAFCVFSHDFKTLYYSGANIPCYIVRANGSLEQNKGERQHIGFNTKPRDFTTKTIELEKGDMVFITSDGYIDQFGAETNKKFMRKKFMNLIVDIRELPMKEQAKKINQAHEEWRGDKEQTDDITVMGIRV